MSTSRSTGTRPFWIRGFTVVGKPVAQVITSSPGSSRSSFRSSEVSALAATRFAEEPEFTVRQCLTPITLASRASNSRLKRPVVSQKSNAESTREPISSPSNTFPETGDAALSSHERPAARAPPAHTGAPAPGFRRAARPPRRSSRRRRRRTAAQGASWCGSSDPLTSRTERLDAQQTFNLGFAELANGPRIGRARESHVPRRSRPHRVGVGQS